MIESGGGTGAATIKSHHNVGGLPEDLEFELVEPLRALFKDEVRAVGAELGLPERLVWRQPFPGPGPGDPDRRRRGHARAARRRCARPTRSSRTRSARPASTGSCGSPSACCPDIRTVGVQGDERTYGNVIVIRAVTSDDAMTADWARLPYDLLEQIASRMINEIRPVGRVVLDITEQAAGHDRVGVRVRAARGILGADAAAPSGPDLSLELRMTARVSSIAMFRRRRSAQWPRSRPPRHRQGS